VTEHIYPVIGYRVVDGDTYDLTVDLGFRVHHKVRVRLAYGDTPEIFGKATEEERERGHAAKAAAEKFFADHDGLCVATRKTGKYGRWIGTVWGFSSEGIVIGMLEYLSMRGHLKE
jgi:micrococcal nuclease